MNERLFYANGHLKKPCNAIACKYRGAGVECEKADLKAGMCEKCGWNPLIEMHRIEEAKKRPLWRKPNKSEIFTKGWSNA